MATIYRLTLKLSMLALIIITQVSIAFTQGNSCTYELTHQGNLDLRNEGIFLGNGSLVNGSNDGYIFIDRLGDFIVHYDKEGNKIQRFGRSGSGPGDLTYPIDIALSISNKEIIVADRSPYLSVFSLSNRSHIHDINHGFSRVTGVATNYDGGVFLSAIERGVDIKNSKLIHVYDIENLKIDHSFHKLPQLRDVDAMIYRSHNPVIKTVRQDGFIYVMNIFEPTVYEYSKDFELKRKIVLELDGFIPITDIDESEFYSVQVVTKFNTILGVKIIDNDYLIVNTWRPEVVSNNLPDNLTNRTNYLVNVKDGTSCNLNIDYKLQVTGQSGNKVYFSSPEREDLFYIYKINGEL